MSPPLYRDKNIEISEELIKIDGTTYAVPTINAVSADALDISIIHWVLFFIGIPIALFAIPLFVTDSPNLAVGCLVVGAVLMAPVFIGRGHGLVITTSSGKTTALQHESMAYLKRLESEVLRAISAARSVKPADAHRVSTSQSAAAPDDLMPCPECAELIRTAAKVCRFCGYRTDQAGS